MFQLKIDYPTIEALQDAVAKLNSDGNQLNLPLAEAPKAPTKAAVKKAATATATVEELPAPKKPAAVKAAGKTKYTLDQLKTYVATLVDPSEGEKIKGFAKSYGVAKYSDLSEAQIQQAYADAPTYFASAEDDGAEAEVDPMD